MEDKYKVYEVYIKQSFNYCWYEFKWFKRILKSDRYTSDGEKIGYILAKNENEAIEIYKERYKWVYNRPLNYLWNWQMTGACENGWVSENPNWEHNVKANEIHLTFNQLKEELRAEELLAYCKQEMYPIEVLIK